MCIRDRTLREELGGEDWTLGEERYARHMRVLEENREAYAQLDEAQQALRAKEPERALELADAAIDAYPEEAAFHAVRGQALARMGEEASAIAALDAAIERNDGYYSYHLDRGLLHRARGDDERARTDLERSASLLPTAPAHLALGQLAEADGARADAIGHYEKAASAEGFFGERAREALSRLQDG